MDIIYLLMTVLKVIGSILLITILSLLVIMVVVFIAPINYKFYIHHREETHIDIYISWLYSIVIFRYLNNSEQQNQGNLKLFGISINYFKQKNKKIKPKNQASKKSKISIKDDIKSQDDSLLDDKSMSNTIHVNTSNDFNKDNQSIIKTKPRTRLKDIFQEILSFKYKIRLLEDTISWIANLLKRLGPSTLYLDLEIGREDPSATGKLIGAIYMFYPLYYSFANIKGNYEKECLYGTIKGRGKFSLGRMMYEFIKYLRLKSVKELLKLIKDSRKDKRDGNKISK